MTWLPHAVLAKHMQEEVWMAHAASATSGSYVHLGLLTHGVCGRDVCDAPTAFSTPRHDSQFRNRVGCFL
jgi:hypothetical protein